MPNLATQYNCTGCMACKDKCPTKAIYQTIGNDGHKYIKINEDKCIECKLCEKTCPAVNNLTYGDNSIHTNKFYAGWAKNNKLRGNAATSGIFGAIAKYFLDQGGWIAGAIIDGIDCKYIVTNSIDDIARLQGSKYTYSNPKGIFGQILALLKSGDIVLFSGLPCHVAALISFIPSSLQTHLYTIDLICGGVSSPILIKRFVKEHSDLETIISFRNKQNGWKPTGYKYTLTYKLKNGRIVSEPKNSRNLITDGFACELTDRYSCYNCMFTGIHRLSDITIGDLWQDNLFPKEHINGVSSLIVHSEKGTEILSSSEISYHEIDFIRVLYPNHRIFNGKSIKQFFPERRLIGWCFKYLPYKSIVRIYGSDLKTCNILWWPIAAYRIISFKIARILTKRRSNRILKEISK